MMTKYPGSPVPVLVIRNLSFLCHLCLWPLSFVPLSHSTPNSLRPTGAGHFTLSHLPLPIFVSLMPNIRRQGFKPNLKPHPYHVAGALGFVAAHGGDASSLGDETVSPKSQKPLHQVTILAKIKPFVEAANFQEMIFPTKNHAG